MPVLKDGRVVDGDILEMAAPFVIHSSIEAWIITVMAAEIRTLRAIAEEYDDLNRHMAAGGDFFSDGNEA